MARILVVDDEPDLCEILRFNLESEGFEVTTAQSGEHALELLGDNRYALVLLDVMLEGMSGVDMASKLRSKGDDTPVIFLTALGSDSAQLAGFEAGGDDYISKPFSFPTVLARIRAVLRRTQQNPHETISSHGLSIDENKKTVCVDGSVIQMTKKEFLILSLLMNNPGRHFSREEIMARVWDDDICVGDRSVDVHIARLRRKIGKAAVALVNYSGFGYAFKPEMMEEK